MTFHVKKALWIFTAVISFAVIPAKQACADDSYTFVVKKQDDKEKARWNLTDWLTQRDKMRMQDLWLALHSPSPYEYFIGGNFQMNELVPGGSQTAWEAFVGAYSSIFGLEGRYEAFDFKTHWYGIFNFRFFGLAEQATNMTLQLGVRDTEGRFTYRNALAGLAVTLYISKYFGFDGLYRYYFPSTPTSSGAQTTGQRFQCGAFIDFRNLRLFGGYRVENSTFWSVTSAQVGTKLYF